ncbi:MAG: helix-turn-helix transcriptional regulator [Bacteroidetes bacterium]|nr:helix-turn-helix transcriptional regulator [Bacteroidota bacterium]
MSLSKTGLQQLFGQHLKKIRVGKNLTQTQLAKLMKKDQQSLQRAESGQVSPNLFYLYNIAKALDVSISDVLDFKVKTEKKKDKKKKKKKK